MAPATLAASKESDQGGVIGHVRLVGHGRVAGRQAQRAVGDAPVERSCAPPGGATWQPTLDVDLEVHQVVVADDDTVLAAKAHGPCRQCRPGRELGRVDDGVAATYARAVAVAGDIADVGVNLPRRVPGATVYRRSLHGGEPFHRTSIGLPSTVPGNVDTFCLVADDLAALGPSPAASTSPTTPAAWATVAAGPPVTCMAFA